MDTTVGMIAEMTGVMVGGAMEATEMTDGEEAMVTTDGEEAMVTTDGEGATVMIGGEGIMMTGGATGHDLVHTTAMIAGTATTDETAEITEEMIKGTVTGPGNKEGLGFGSPSLGWCRRRRYSM